MTKPKLIIAALVVGLAAILVVFGPAPTKAGTDNTLRVTTMSGPDSIDPGVSYMSVSWSMQVNAYNGLLTYRKASGAEGTELVPDLAEEMPKISSDGKLISFKVRKGVKFGPPANREVLPSDIKYAFDRNAKIPSQGAFFYNVVEGFEQVVKTKKGSVSGIVADDKARTITFKLNRPDATFLYVLALPFSFVVPKGTPPKDLSMQGFVPATGPYMFSSYDPSRGITLKRNPNFKQWSEHTPEGKVDQIDITFRVSDENAITMITQGKADAAMTAIPRSKLPFLKSNKEWQPYLHTHRLSRISYIWMNTNVAPFDNAKVRQAVNWAINRRALVKLGGGSGAPWSNIMPPTMPGSLEDDAYPKQDLEKAKALVAESGTTGSEVVIWCMTTPPNPDSAQYLQEQLRMLGYNVRTRCVDPSAYYSLVGNEKTKTQIGFAGWGADFPEGSNFIDVNLNGAHINPEHSNNLAWYRGSDKQIKKINEMLDLDERAAAWGKLDREIMTKDAPWAPISNGVQRNLLSKRVGNYVFHPVYDTLFMLMTVNGEGENNSKTHAGEVGYEEEADA